MSEARPVDCTFRLQDEGKPYPRSGCAHCGRTITSGLGRQCHHETDRIEALERDLKQAREMFDDCVLQHNEQMQRAEAAEASLARKDEAMRGVLDRMTDSYKAKNGRDVGIQADDGEKCWIVHSDDIENLRAALGSGSGGWQECATEGCEHRAFFWFERGGVGSKYCHDCYMRVQALSAAPAGKPEGGA